MRTKIILTTALIIGFGFFTNAQVGIGNPTPDSSSVLDLTNPNNRGLVLPRASNGAAMSTTINGMTYFYNNNIYYKTDSGYNSISPWKFKFNGNISNDIYYNLGGKIGIGNSNLSQSPESPLQIETVDSVNLIDNGSIMVGKSIDKNMVLNNSEIQSRNAGSGSALKINENGGDVTFGSNTTKVNVKASDRMQELHTPTNTYYDLLPAGTILMWYGDTSTIPTGFALCDGKSYTKSDGTTAIITPNLSGRFVVASGNNLETNYNAHATGGQDNVTLTEAQMPKHLHNINHGHGISDPGHKHSLRTYNSGSGRRSPTWDNDDSNTTDDDTTTDLTGISVNNHSGNSGEKGNSQSHENRPKYYSLVYMMKL